MKKYEIIRLFSEKEEKVTDAVTEEIPLAIHVNGKEVVTLLASPTDLEELAIGFLFTSGFIRNFEEIKSIATDPQCWVVSLELKDDQIDSRLAFKRVLTSGCGRGTLFYDADDLGHKNIERVNFAIERDQVFQLMKEFQTRSSEFKETGGVHSAALADGNDILAVREDIGRHNAIDKIFGFALKNHIHLRDKVILSSGRVSSEILVKIQKTLVPILISRSAPTNQAIQRARYADLTLIGFVRGGRMNIYSGRERIL